MTLALRVVGDREVVEYLASIPSHLAAIILRKFQARATDISGYVKNTLLNGQLLRRKIGRLASSIVGRVYSSKNKISLSLSSRGNVPYARIYEEGGHIPPHIIKPKTARGLYFRGTFDGKMLFLDEVMHPGYDVPARRYLQRGIEDRAGDVLFDLRSAIAEIVEGI